MQGPSWFGKTQGFHGLHRLTRSRESQRDCGRLGLDFGAAREPGGRPGKMYRREPVSRNDGSRTRLSPPILAPWNGMRRRRNPFRGGILLEEDRRTGGRRALERSRGGILPLPSHELDRHMRSRENEIETSIEEGAFLVVRLDGRGFTRLTETLGFSKPFDDTFHRHMVETSRHLMGCGFPVLYGYTQSDEISLVLARDHGAFGRRVQKTVSVLAGEASASFSLALGARAVFDARVLALREPEEVVDYLGWRRSDAVRNARVLHAYWLLRGQGTDPRQATRMPGSEGPGSRYGAWR